MEELFKILMLEDNVDDAEITKRLLFKSWPDCQIMLAIDKDRYKELLANFQPDIILSDHALPQFNSAEALSMARSRFPDIPFIMLTGEVSEEFAVTIIQLGADDYILKDRLNRLPAAIEAALNKRNIEKEKAEATQQLIRSEEKYRTLIEHAFDGIIIYAPNGTILDCNATACTLMGYIKDELNGHNIAELFFKEDLKIRPLYFETLKAGYPTLDYRRLKRKDGSFIEMEIGTKMMSDGSLMAIGRDITERKEAERKIRQSETNLRALFENTSEGFMLIDNEGIVISFNKKSEEYTWLVEKPRIKNGDLLIDFIEESRRKFFKENFASVLKGQNVYYDHCFNRAGAKMRWIGFTMTPVIEKSLIKGVCISGRDITETKTAEEVLNKKLLENQILTERLSNILNTLPAKIALLDQDGRIAEINEHWKNTIGRNPFLGADFAVGENYLRLVENTTTGQDEKSVSKGIEEVLQNKLNDFTKEYSFEEPAGPIWYRMMVSPLLQKEKAGAVVMHIDITERKNAEAVLRATLKELSDYKIALDESSIVSITNPKGIITYVNENFCKISQYQSHELLGKEHQIVKSGYHSKEFIKTLWATIGEGRIWRNEMKNRNKSGDFYWLDITIVPFLNERGKPVQYVSINKDITQKKLMEQEIEEQKVQEHKKIIRAILKGQEKERNHIGQELHDNINQILAGAKLYLSMTGHKKEALKELIQYPLELIDNAISEIRILSSRHVTPPRNINLEDLIRSLLEKLKMSTSIETNFSFRPFHKQIDDDLKLNIYRIIQEKIANVVKHAQASHVEVALESDDKMVYIFVKDNGKGFDINDKRNGIGISNMINRVESFNGNMQIDTIPGSGCQVKISIPIHE
jgi:PAS domain S-box-containing protein